MEPDLAVVAALSAEDDHVSAAARLTTHGWTRCGLGDWAVVLRSPSRTLAARIAPFDPVAPYTAQLFREAAPSRQVPALHAYVELDGGAVCTVMELLGPVAEKRAAAFFRALEARAPELVELAAVIDRVLGRARAELPWCGPLDPNPSNVMARPDGSRVLTDPFYADGPPSLRLADDRRAPGRPPSRPTHAATCSTSPSPGPARGTPTSGRGWRRPWQPPTPTWPADRETSLSWCR